MCSHIPLKEWTQIRGASKVQTHKRKHSIHTNFHKNTERDLFHEQKRLVTWKQQSTKVNLETITSSQPGYKISLFKWILPVWKQKLHRMRRKNSWKFSEPSQKPKVIYIDDLCEFGKYCKELSWNHRAAISHRLETRNCRTSCTSNKRRDISRIIAIWIDWRMMVRFHEMPLQSAECPKRPDRREILIWTKIWGIIQWTIYII